MTIFINEGQHVSKAAGFVPIPLPWQRVVVEWAVKAAGFIATNTPNADLYFKHRLSKGVSLTDLVTRPDIEIWLNYTVAHAGGVGVTTFGVTELNSGEIAFRPPAFADLKNRKRNGGFVVLKTLIHELAHVAGAPGGRSKQAEEAVYWCGLGTPKEYNKGKDDPRTPYDPTFIGQLNRRGFWGGWG
jgi:hypothetical protein